jgi:GNAT superfamily N-acetyltransferase
MASVRLLAALLLVLAQSIAAFVAPVQASTTCAPCMRPRMQQLPTLGIVFRAVDDRAGTATFQELGSLCATCLFDYRTEHERMQLEQEMTRNLIQRYSGLNRRRHVLLVAEDSASGEIVGGCGVEAAPLTPEGRATPRLATDPGRMRIAPLLSNLVVHPHFRRQGIAKELMRTAEEQVLSWGFSELILKVRAEPRMRKDMRSPDVQLATFSFPAVPDGPAAMPLNVPITSRDVFSPCHACFSGSGGSWQRACGASVSCAWL